MPGIRMVIKFGNKFRKAYDKAPANIRLAFDNRYRLFLQNHFEPLLSNHALSGKYRGYRSINITGDWRAIFREIGNYQLVIFETLGTHSQLYK